MPAGGAAAADAANAGNATEPLTDPVAAMRAMMDEARAAMFQQLDARFRSASEQMETSLNAMAAGVQAKMMSAVQAMDTLGTAQTATRSKRALDELQMRQDVAVKFRAIHALQTADPIAREELSRNQFAATRFEQATVGAKLAAEWVSHLPPGTEGAEQALKDLADATAACEAGGQGLWHASNMLTMVTTDSDKFPLEFCSTAATRVVSKEVPGFDAAMGKSKTADELIAARTKEWERLQELKPKSASGASGGGPRLAGPGDKCGKCGVLGHFAKDCKTVAVVGTSGAHAAGAAGAP